MQEFKETISTFRTKNEAIDFLVKETGLSKKECREAYDIAIKTDFEKINKV